MTLINCYHKNSKSVVLYLFCQNKCTPDTTQSLWDVTQVALYLLYSPNETDFFLIWHIGSQTEQTMRFQDLFELSRSLYEKKKVNLDIQQITVNQRTCWTTIILFLSLRHYDIKVKRCLIKPAIINCNWHQNFKSWTPGHYPLIGNIRVSSILL